MIQFADHYKDLYTKASSLAEKLPDSKEIRKLGDGSIHVQTDDGEFSLRCVEERAGLSIRACSPHVLHDHSTRANFVERELTNIARVAGIATAALLVVSSTTVDTGRVYNAQEIALRDMSAS